MAIQVTGEGRQIATDDGRPMRFGEIESPVGAASTESYTRFPTERSVDTGPTCLTFSGDTPVLLIPTNRRFLLPHVAMLLLVGQLVAGRVPADDTEIRPPSKGERIVFLGDSITQAGDKKRGYVVLVREAIAKTMPDAGVEVLGAGISGHKVPDLEKRLDRDVIEKKPTTVVIYIGINDVWHSKRGQGTPKDVYEKGLRSLVERIRAAGSRVILCTPSVIGEKAKGENKFDTMLDEYADITRTVAADMKTGLVDLRKAFVDHLATANADNQEKGLLTYDGVHLNAEGDQFVADRMLEGLGVAVKAPAAE